MDYASEAIGYYEQRYAIACQYGLKVGEKIFLGDRENRTCRFCNATAPAVSFRKEAHALPECVGNNSLFTYYECDSCNEAFGKGCENDFGNWSLPLRTMARVRGKTGVPSIKRGPNGVWRVDNYQDGLRVSVDEAEGFFEPDEVNKTLAFHLRRPPYRPVMVAKCLAKMALSIMPEAELKNFEQALAWIRPGNVDTIMVAPTPFFHTFIAGPAVTGLAVAVLTRRDDLIATPYCYIIVCYGCELLQLAVPSMRDYYLHNQGLELVPFSHTGRSDRIELLRYNSFDVVRDEGIVVTAGYGLQPPPSSDQSEGS